MPVLNGGKNFTGLQAGQKEENYMGCRTDLQKGIHQGCDLMQQVLWRKGHTPTMIEFRVHMSSCIRRLYIREEALLETELVLFPFLQHSRYGPCPGVMNAGNGLRGITVSLRKGIEGPGSQGPWPAVAGRLSREKGKLT